MIASILYSGGRKQKIFYHQNVQIKNDSVCLLDLNWKYDMKLIQKYNLHKHLHSMRLGLDDNKAAIQGKLYVNNDELFV